MSDWAGLGTFSDIFMYRHLPLLATAALIAAATPPATAASAEIVSLANPSFEDNGIGSGDFLNAQPSGWVRIVSSGRTVGVIGEDRNLVANTPDGIAWLHLQTNGEAPADPPRIGQVIGSLADITFGDPANPKLWLHGLASRRLNESTVIHLTASLYAAPAGATDWTGGTLIDSAVVDTNLANLNDGDPGSIANLALMMDLDNAAAQAAHPGGDYWIVLANTMSRSGQLHLDRINLQTSDTTDPGPVVPPPTPIAAADQVAGDLILFNDNGGWCWYQDERILVDRDNDDLVIASVANYLGYGGEPRDGDMDVTTFKHASGSRTRVTMATIPTLNKGDDHNVAALWQRPDGRYFACYTGHNYGAGYNGGETEPKSFYRSTTLANDGSAWDSELEFTWPENGSGEDDVTYTNLHFMSAEGSGQGRLYNIARADDRTPSIAYSDDQGATWTYGGKLSVSTTGSSYSNGYFVFTSNGVDRIDFMCTEHHPRDYNNSIYHGYIKDGKSYNSLGKVIDDDIFDVTAPAPQDFTRVWATSPVTASSYHHAWTMEVEMIDGQIQGLFTTRHGNVQETERVGDSDHRLFYARFDGASWQTHELCKMGNSLDGKEGDYTGLGSIHPNDASTIYISVEHDPRDATPLPKHEIFKGHTSDQGVTWAWTPITENSTVENFRPIVPAWKDGRTALLWLRGRYPFQRDYEQSVVGLIDRPDEEAALVRYIDADSSNTTLADGSPLFATGPSDSNGSADNQWHQHTGLGNGGSAYTASDSGTENAPAIRTRLSGLADGTYDVYAYFWSRPADDWRIRAGFSTGELLVFRRYSCQQAEVVQFTAPVSVLDSSQALYRAYVGRRIVSGGAAVDVSIDDFGGAASAGSQRSAYDGIGVAEVLPALEIEDGQSFVLPSDSGPYAFISNAGSLTVKGSSDLEVAGAFTNDGFLDLLGFTGALPAGFVNSGSILDASNAELGTAISRSGDSIELSVAGYAGHFYQAQYSSTLAPGDWQDFGPVRAGQGPQGSSSPLAFQDTNILLSEAARFYRVWID